MRPVVFEVPAALQGRIGRIRIVDVVKVPIWPLVAVVDRPGFDAALARDATTEPAALHLSHVAHEPQQRKRRRLR